MAGRILVIDDDRLFAEALVILLHRAGFDAAALTPGREALDAIRAAHAKKPIGLLISDLYMPEPDGFEVLRFARAHLAGVSVIGISGWNESLLAAMRLLGAAAVHTKHVDAERLIADAQRLIWEEELSVAG